MEYCRHKYNSTINEVLASSCELCRVLAFEPALSIILINVLTIATPCYAPLTEKHILLDYPDGPTGHPAEILHCFFFERHF